MKYLILLLPILLFALNEYYNNKIYSFMTKFYSCCKMLMVVIPLILLYLNPELLQKLLIHFKDVDTKTLFQNNNKKVRRNVNESKKKYVAFGQRWICQKCNQILDAAYEIDHIIPLYKGGNNDVTNLEALCRNCHGKKTLKERTGEKHNDARVAGGGRG